ncbi:MAG TPA: periplasmic heavy metal sensor [Rhodobacterales bacterium]|nr:periplasmic heavy metal sensor [Rhodobacterales bacterium]
MRNDKGSQTVPLARPRRWPKVLLTLSLTLNLVVIGGMVGAMLRDGHDTRRFGPPDRNTMRATGLGPFFDAMPRDVRNRLGLALRDRGGLGPDRAALEADLRAMLAVLRAEPFDPAEFEAILANQQTRAQSRIATGRSVLVEQVGEMTPDERARFADGLEARFARAMAHGHAAPPPKRGN